MKDGQKGINILKKVLKSFRKMSDDEYKKLFESAQDMEKVNLILYPIFEAKDFTSNAHKNQKYGDKPYLTHLQHVEEVLFRFGYNDNALLNAAWLHDIIEDTNVTIEEIKNKFGKEIADIVYAVKGINRKERLLKTYPKIRSNQKAIILKLAE